jgi:hypothetical protein
MNNPKTTICGAMALICGILATQGGDPHFVLWCQRLAAIFTGLVGYFAHDGKPGVPPVIGIFLAVGLVLFLTAGCTVIKQSVTTKAKDGTEQTTRATAFSLWDGKAVVEKLRVSNSPRGGQMIGISGLDEETTGGTNALQILKEVRAITGK